MSKTSKYAILLVCRYPAWFGWAGFLSMALFHLPLMLNRKINFYKLLGTGRNGTFDLRPDWRQWAIWINTNEVDETNHEISDIQVEQQLTGGFIQSYLRLFNVHQAFIVLKPFSSKGSWDKNVLFETAAINSAEDNAAIAVLTRATIHFKKLKSFWKHVPAVAEQMHQANGLLYSIGIGEAPVYRQATFSIWNSESAMKEFAYRQHEHKDVIKKTYQQNWYSEEMFTRFKIISYKNFPNLAGKV